MLRTKKVALNSLIMGVQHIVVNLISIFVVGYVARELGENDYGVFSLSFTFPQFFIIIGNFGTRSVATREMASNRDKAISFLGSILPMRLSLLCCMLIVTPVAAYLMGYTEKTLLIIFLATVSLVIELLARIIFDVFQAFERIGKIAIRDIVIRLFTGLSSVLVLFLGFGLTEVCYVYVVGACLGLAINLVTYKKHFPWPPIIIDKKRSIQMLKLSAPFALIGFVSGLYVKVDILMLSKILNNSEVGIYNAAANLTYRLNFVSDAIATAAFPAISQLFWTDRNNVNKIVNNSFMVIIILSLPITVGGFLLSEEITELIYGVNYAQTSVVLKVLISTIPFMFINVFFSYILSAIRKQNIVLLISIFLLLTNIGINFILIPRLAGIGAAIATLSTEIMSTAIYCFFIFAAFSISLSIKTLLAVIVATFVMGVYIIATINQPILMTIPLAAACYLILFSVCAEKKYNILKIVRKKIMG